MLSSGPRDLLGWPPVWRIAISRRHSFLVAALLGTVAAAPVAAAERSFLLTVDGPRVTGEGITGQGNARTLRVRQGDRIEILWSSAAALTLHLHGYDRTVEVPARGTAVLVFDAHAAGRFPVAVHDARAGGRHSHRTLLYLEVRP